jgi:hypothetical protein
MGQFLRDKTQRLTDVQNELKATMPELIGHYDALGNFIITDTGYMKKLTEETLKAIEAEQLRKRGELDKKAGASGSRSRV